MTHFNDIPTFSVLKNHILSLICPKKKCIFGIHDLLGLRYLFQLRVGLSSIKYHKNVVTSLTPLLKNVFVIRVMKIRIISYFCVRFLLLDEQS